MMKRFIGARQTTLASEIVLNGIGVHGGEPVSISILPAEASTGIRFVLANGSEIAAEVSSVSNVTLCTVLSDGNGRTVATVEHLLAALRGLGVDNAYIEIDSTEVPIMDGSSTVFVQAIDEVGVIELDTPRKFIKVLKPIRVEDGGCWAELVPHTGFHLDVEIDFRGGVIGRQRMQLELTPRAFRTELSRARTFGFMRDVEQLWAAGRALGASLDNTVAIGDDRVINPEGLRYADEFVRHKMLDAVGDLALSGAPLLGAYRSCRGGHRLNTMALQALFSDSDAWTTVYAPSVRDTAHVDMSFGLAVANYSADRT